MTFNPGVSFFIRFHELDPSRQRQCIFFTQRGARCKWDCSEADNTRAKELHATIIASDAETDNLELLEEYILCNCCRSGRARHRDRIQDIDLLVPLAERWQDEIEQRARRFSSPRGTGSNYALRPRDGATSASPRRVLSEFRPHIAEPGPFDSTGCKMLDELDDRDFEIGSLYIYDRESSPGHVKIGWTARSVQARLDDWSTCGYEPNLLFDVHHVPHAQRAETLSHYELIKEWRRERQCKAPWCRKSHQEWFEVSKDRAIQVVGGWAEFFKTARPYHSRGSLRSKWVKILRDMNKLGEEVTAKKLLEYHKAALAGKSTLMEESAADTRIAPKVESSDGDFRPSLKTGGQESREEALPQADSSCIEQPTSLQEQALPEVKPLPDQAKTPSRTTNIPGLIEISSQTQFTFTFEPPGGGSSEKLLSPVAKPLIASDARDEASALNKTPTNKKLPPEQIPLPPSPVKSPEDAAHLTQEAQLPNIETGTANDKRGVIKPSSLSAITDTSQISEIDALIPLSGLASLTITDSKVFPDINTRRVTRSRLLTPPPEPDVPVSPDAATSSGIQTEVISKVPAPLGEDLLKAMLSLGIKEQEILPKSASGVAGPVTSVEV